MSTKKAVGVVGVAVSPIAVQIAGMADKYGIYPHHVMEDEQLVAQLALSGISREEITPEVMTTADRLFHKAMESTMEHVDRFNGGRVSRTPLSGAVVEEYTDKPRRSKPRLTDDPVDPVDDLVTDLGGKRKCVRRTVLGYPISRVIIWMGKDGWDFDDAYAAITDIIGVYDLSPAMVRTSLYAGRTGSRGVPAPITRSQAKTLRSYAK